MHDVFYFTDVHGCYDLYRAAMDYCLEQDPECTIVYGGDACDRGPDGYKIMKELLDNPQVIYLKGNHEDMFVSAARFILNDYKDALEKKVIEKYLYMCYTKDFYSAEVQLSLYNGGLATLRDWMLDGMPNDFVSKIHKLPITFTYENIDFCHAGGRYETFKRVQEDEYNNDFVDLDDMNELLWDRSFFGIGWAPNRTCIFGHTPANHLPARYYGQDKSLANIYPCSYVGLVNEKMTGKKIDMDTETFNTNKLFVINCLTEMIKNIIV